MATLVCKYIKDRKEELLKFQNDPQTVVRPDIRDLFMHTIHTDEVICVLLKIS